MRPGRDLLRIGATLRLDAVAAQVSAELRAQDLRSLVFRGPAFRHVLYGDGSYRAYDDVDLLVAHADLERARGALRRHGFSPAVESDRSQPWVREDGVTIDLHTTLVGIAAPPEKVWDVFSRDTDALVLAGENVEIPGATAIALTVALHAAQHGARAVKALADLERALEQLPFEVWRAAAEQASRLSAMPAFATGLALVPAGAELAGRLELPTDRPEEVALRAASAPVTAIGLQRLAAAPGLRKKARLLAGELVPEATFMRSMYPIARRGTSGLAAAYVWRPFWLLWHLGPALRARRRARRAVR